MLYTIYETSTCWVFRSMTAANLVVSSRQNVIKSYMPWEMWYMEGNGI